MVNNHCSAISRFSVKIDPLQSGSILYLMYIKFGTSPSLWRVPTTKCTVHLIPFNYILVNIHVTGSGILKKLPKILVYARVKKLQAAFLNSFLGNYFGKTSYILRIMWFIQ